MKKTITTLAAMCCISSIHAATVQTVAYGGGLASEEGWSVTGTGGEFLDPRGWAIYGPYQATRGLGGDLSIGQTVTIDLATLGVASGDFVGVDFRQGTTTGIGYNFQGGGTNYGVFSSSGTTDSGIGFSTAFKTISLKRDTAADYTLSIDSTNFASLTLANSATAIDEIRVFNETSGTGNDVLFDNFTVVPEPSSAALLGLGGLALILRRRK